MSKPTGSLFKRLFGGGTASATAPATGMVSDRPQAPAPARPHTFLTPTPPQNSRSPNPASLRNICLSDHIPVKFKVKFDGASEVSLATFNMANKFKSAEEVSHNGKSNNQYNYSETESFFYGPQGKISAFTKRVDAEKEVIRGMLQGSDSKLDFFSLQEVNGITTTTKPDSSGRSLLRVKQTFIDEMMSLGYGVIYSNDGRLVGDPSNNKSLITLYNLEKYSHKGNVILDIPRGNKRSSLMITDFVDIHTGQKIAIGNAHLGFDVKPDEIKSAISGIRSLCLEQGTKLLIAGDTNHVHTEIDAISDGKATAFDAVVDYNGNADYTQQVIVDSRNGSEKTYDSLMLSEDADVTVVRDYTLEQKVNSASISYVNCVEGRVESPVRGGPMGVIQGGSVAQAVTPSFAGPQVPAGRRHATAAWQDGQPSAALPQTLQQQHLSTSSMAAVSPVAPPSGSTILPASRAAKPFPFGYSPSIIVPTRRGGSGQTSQGGVGFVPAPAPVVPTSVPAPAPAPVPAPAQSSVVPTLASVPASTRASAPAAQPSAASGWGTNPFAPSSLGVAHSASPPGLMWGAPLPLDVAQTGDSTSSAHHTSNPFLPTALPTQDLAPVVPAPVSLGRAAQSQPSQSRSSAASAASAASVPLPAKIPAMTPAPAPAPAKATAPTPSAAPAPAKTSVAASVPPAPAPSGNAAATDEDPIKRFLENLETLGMIPVGGMHNKLRSKLTPNTIRAIDDLLMKGELIDALGRYFIDVKLYKTLNAANIASMECTDLFTEEFLNKIAPSLTNGTPVTNILGREGKISILEAAANISDADIVIAHLILVLTNIEQGEQDEFIGALQRNTADKTWEARRRLASNLNGKIADLTILNKLSYKVVTDIDLLCSQGKFIKALGEKSQATGQLTGMHGSLWASFVECLPSSIEALKKLFTEGQFGKIRGKGLLLNEYGEPESLDKKKAMHFLKDSEFSISMFVVSLSNMTHEMQEEITTKLKANIGPEVPARTSASAPAFPAPAPAPTPSAPVRGPAPAPAAPTSARNPAASTAPVPTRAPTTAPAPATPTPALGGVFLDTRAFPGKELRTFQVAVASSAAAVPTPQAPAPQAPTPQAQPPAPKAPAPTPATLSSNPVKITMMPSRYDPNS